MGPNSIPKRILIREIVSALCVAFVFIVCIHALTFVFVILLQTNSVQYGFTDRESENEMVAIKREILVNQSGQFVILFILPKNEFHCKS